MSIILFIDDNYDEDTTRGLFCIDKINKTKILLESEGHKCEIFNSWKQGYDFLQDHYNEGIIVLLDYKVEGHDDVDRWKARGDYQWLDVMNLDRRFVAFKRNFVPDMNYIYSAIFLFNYYRNDYDKLKNKVKIVGYTDYYGATQRGPIELIYRGLKVNFEQGIHRSEAPDDIHLKVSRFLKNFIKKGIAQISFQEWLELRNPSYWQKKYSELGELNQMKINEIYNSPPSIGQGRPHHPLRLHHWLDLEINFAVWNLLFDEKRKSILANCGYTSGWFHGRIKDQPYSCVTPPVRALISFIPAEQPGDLIQSLHSLKTYLVKNCKLDETKINFPTALAGGGDTPNRFDYLWFNFPALACAFERIINGTSESCVKAEFNIIIQELTINTSLRGIMCEIYQMVGRNAPASYWQYQPGFIDNFKTDKFTGNMKEVKRLLENAGTALFYYFGNDSNNESLQKYDLLYKDSDYKLSNKYEKKGKEENILHPPKFVWIILAEKISFPYSTAKFKEYSWNAIKTINKETIDQINPIVLKKFGKGNSLGNA